VKRLIVVCALFMSAQATYADELLVVKSARPVMETLDRLEITAKSKGFSIVARVDHSGAAAKTGLQLRPTALLIFGNPQVGTPLMQCDQRAGIDLPLKALAWQDETGQVWLGMVDPEVLKARYDLNTSCNEPIALMRRVVVGLLDTVSKGP